MLPFKLLVVAAGILSLLWLYLTPDGLALVAALGNSQTLRLWLDELAGIGPLAVIMAMAVAIVFNPIPSLYTCGGASPEGGVQFPAPFGTSPQSAGHNASKPGSDRMVRLQR